MKPRRAIIQDQRGNMAMMFALVLPLLLGALGGGVDYARFHLMRQSLQETADMAALAGARQYVIADKSGKVPENIAKAVAEEGVARSDAPDAKTRASADPAEGIVTVEISHAFRPTFLVAIYKSPLSFTVRSTAKAVGAANVCVIGLKDSGNDVLLLDDAASLAGDDCAIYVNSTGKKALSANASSFLSAVQMCSAGGYEGDGRNFDPLPTTDCPPREDPLVGRPSPSPPAGCDYTDRKLKAYNGSISPGVYCGGLKVEDDSDVTLDPGIYFIKDGKLELTDNTRITGTDVGFFFLGADADMLIDDEVEVALQAPISGAMAGVLFWHDAAATGSKKFMIKSPNVSTLVGTIYLPKGEFIGEIDAGGSIADASAYTAIIADRIKLAKNSNLVLHSNYKATDVPLPDGLAGGGSVYLRE